MTLTAEQREMLVGIINPIMQKIYRDDIRLIQRGGLERSIAFRFGLYLNDAIRQNEWLSNLHLDVEYNKNGLAPKRTPRRPNGVQPDLILHTREIHQNNILVIEFKGWWNNYDRQDDRIKLEDFVDQDGEYRYGLGILIELNLDVPTYEYFQDY